MRKPALLAVLTGLLVLAGTGPASAGGPTSVMLVQPDTGRSAALHTTQPTYQVLSDLVQTTAALTDRDAGPDAHTSGTAVRITWLIHDVQVWRVDEVFIDASGGPWIATRENWDGNPLEGDRVWHRSAAPGRLLQLLADLKVLDPKAPLVDYHPSVPAPQPEAEAAAAAASAEVAASADNDRLALSGWRWVLPGLLAGALLTYLAIRLSPAWQRRSTGPRWELVDESDKS